MIDFNRFLKNNLYGVMATLDENKPKTRVLQYLFSDGNKVYIGTTNYKEVYKQLKACPYVSFCSHDREYSFILSVNGKVTFVDDIFLKTKAMEEYPAIKDIYKTPDNPVFEIFYIDVEEVKTFDFSTGVSEKYVIR
ncbi:MAG: pyridoxamine 5'-phosphate oxidase family protein [Leptotrichiaceae bacterium]|nr:pyridoxamine 5'-phosphate oxidase family protein [Leptotrichiaceae bacterium]